MPQEVRKRLGSAGKTPNIPQYIQTMDQFPGRSKYGGWGVGVCVRFVLLTIVLGT